jgi:threonine/homoserine/homoserine lactone efflux protein
MTISVAVNAAIIISAGSIATFFMLRPTWLKVQRWVMGGILGGLAVRMAIDTRR